MLQLNTEFEGFWFVVFDFKNNSMAPKIFLFWILTDLEDSNKFFLGLSGAQFREAEIKLR